MKKLATLTGTKILSKKDQQVVKGGGQIPFLCHMEDDNGHCPDGYHCVNQHCIPN